MGPTIPRRRLGEQLAGLRVAAGLSQPQIAGRLGCSLSKIQKIEAGDVGVKLAELEIMLDAYGVDDRSVRDELLGLRDQGRQRGWWATYGQLPAPLTTLLGLEGAAVSLRIFEPLLVPELLRTPAYAGAVADAGAGPRWDGVPPDRLAALTMVRRERLLAGRSPRIEVILDEAVLRRPVGGRTVLTEQLEWLASTAQRVSLRVVPLHAGGHPGLAGPLTMLGFGNVHSPVGLVTGHAGLQYLEKPPELRRCVAAFDAITAAALSPAASLRLLGEALAPAQG